MKLALPKRSDWDDQSIELIIGQLLRIGVLISAAVVVIGGIIYLVRNGHVIADYTAFRGELSTLRSFDGIFHGVSLLSGRAIVQLGLLLLIATPVARVIFCALAFFLQRDYLYVIFTLVVLAVLTYSIAGPSLH